MEVHPDEGGVTKTVGGIQWIILPAGYLGSAVWGMALVIASARELAAEIAAGVLIFFLIVFIFFAHNNYLRLLNFGFLVLLGGLLALNIWTDFHALQYVTLFVGVMSCLFSIYDIWDDLLSRRVNESDASVFAKMTHTSSRCWGAIWGLLALVSLVAAVYFNLLVARDEGDQLDSLGDASTGTKIALGAAVVIVGLSVLHTALTRRCTSAAPIADPHIDLDDSPVRFLYEQACCANAKAAGSVALRERDHRTQNVHIGIYKHSPINSVTTLRLL